MPHIWVPAGQLILRAWRVVRWYLPALLMGIGPLMVVIGANVATVPLREAVITRSLLAIAGAVLVILWALRLLQRDLAARATWLASFLLLFNLYEASAQGLRAIGLQIWGRDPLFAVPYLITILAIATLASRPWELRPRDPVPLTLVGALLVFVALAPAVAAERPADPSWRTTADAMIASTLSEQPRADFASPARDIYYIVLDGMGRADVLRNRHKVDLTPLTSALSSRGFYVAAEARSNYSQTSLSLASTLNMTYLDDLVRVTGTTTEDRAPLHYLVQENALMRMASRAGYSVVAIGSDYMVTQEFSHADVCMCALVGLDEVEIAAITLTPLATLPPRLWTTDPYDAHRQKIMSEFDALERFRSGSTRSFVFAHIIAPHPPFVFAKDGSARRSQRPYSLADWRGFGGSREEYVTGYGDQAEFILRRTVEVIDQLLKRPGPAPIIVVHGDHGPGSMIRWDGPDPAAMRERMGIFAAYYYPDGNADLYPTITPVNGARVLARNFGVGLKKIRDESFFADWDRPYEFVPVAEQP